MVKPTTDPLEKRLKALAATYTAEDIGGILQCSTRHVRRMIDAREIPGMIRIGRLVRFHRGIVDEWLATKAKGVR